MTSNHFADSGDDSHPLPGDYAATTGTLQTGVETAVGYIDPKNAPVAEPGEKRIYARDGSGNVIVEVHLKNDGEAIVLNSGASFTVRLDGTIEGQNGNGFFRLDANGVFNVNGATIDTEGRITSPTQVISPLMTVDGKELRNHTHGGVQTGGSNTGPNN